MKDVIRHIHTFDIHTVYLLPSKGCNNVIIYDTNGKLKLNFASLCSKRCPLCLASSAISTCAPN